MYGFTTVLQSVTSLKISYLAINLIEKNVSNKIKNNLRTNQNFGADFIFL